MALKIEPHGNGVRLSVKVVPGASRDRIVGELGDSLKISVSAPPEGGKANQAVVELLARALSIPQNAVEILSGHGSPRKVVALGGVSSAQVNSLVSESRQA